MLLFRKLQHNKIKCRLYLSSKVSETYRIPTRTEMIKSLGSKIEFDVLVIGGGATGAG
jgi:hypothetical protein